MSSLLYFPPSLSSSQRLQYLKMSSATLSVISLPPNSIPYPLNSNSYPIFLLPVKNLQPQSLGQNPKRLRLSAKFSSVSGDHHPAPYLPAGDILRKLAVSSVILLGLGLSRCAFACTPIPPPVAQSGDHHVIEENGNVVKSEEMENAEDEKMKAEFERWKSKTYALTVPLRIVALCNSLPAAWFKNFMQSQGKRVRLRQEFRQSLQDIFFELQRAGNKMDTNSKSAVSADLVTLGDSWLNFVIKEGLIEPMKGVEEEVWFRNLSDKWKVYLRRSRDGKLDSDGQIWAAPYRWGSIVIAYKKSKFQNHKLTPIEDWADLWRPELAGRISMIDSPREIVGAVLKSMGASYNTHDFTSQVSGGKTALRNKLALLAEQVRLFDSRHYLKAFALSDVWVAVGWSNDVLPAAKRMSNVAVIVPKSGASLWADFWGIPATARLKGENFGGRIRGPSPLVHQWIDFCLQPERALSFKGEVIVGASPLTLEKPIQDSGNLTKNRPQLDTNLVSSIPPPEILSRCEFLEPLPEETLSDYRWLIDSIRKPSHSLLKRLQHHILPVFQQFQPQVESKVV